MSVNQKFNANVSIPITVTEENFGECEGSVTVSVYHNTHSSTLTTWEKDGSNHWRQCNYEYGQCDGSEESMKVDFGSHNYSSGFCIECGQPEPHTHTFAEAWTATEDNHYHKCTGTGCPLNADDLTATNFFLSKNHFDESRFTSAVWTKDGGSIMVANDKRGGKEKLLTCKLFVNVLDR